MITNIDIISMAQTVAQYSNNLVDWRQAIISEVKRILGEEASSHIMFKVLENKWPSEAKQYESVKHDGLSGIEYVFAAKARGVRMTPRYGGPQRSVLVSKGGNLDVAKLKAKATELVEANKVAYGRYHRAQEAKRVTQEATAALRQRLGDTMGLPGVTWAKSDGEFVTLALKVRASEKGNIASLMEWLEAGREFIEW